MNGPSCVLPVFSSFQVTVISNDLVHPNSDTLGRKLVSDMETMGENSVGQWSGAGGANPLYETNNRQAVGDLLQREKPQRFPQQHTDER